MHTASCARGLLRAAQDQQRIRWVQPVQQQSDRSCPPLHRPTSRQSTRRRRASRLESPAAEGSPQNPRRRAGRRARARPVPPAPLQRTRSAHLGLETRHARVHATGPWPGVSSQSQSPSCLSPAAVPRQSTSRRRPFRSRNQRRSQWTNLPLMTPSRATPRPPPRMQSSRSQNPHCLRSSHRERAPAYPRRPARSPRAALGRPPRIASTSRQFSGPISPLLPRLLHRTGKK